MILLLNCDILTVVLTIPFQCDWNGYITEYIGGQGEISMRQGNHNARKYGNYDATDDTRWE